MASAHDRSDRAWLANNSFLLSRPGKFMVLIVSVSLLFAVCLQLPYANDWDHYFRPAGQMLLRGLNPYSMRGFVNPAWVLLLLSPLSILPDNVGQAVLSTMNLGTVAFVARRLGASRIAIAFFVLAPGTLFSLVYGNLDWIPLLGLVMPPSLGLFFVLVKPQMGIGVAAYWLVEAWRQGGYRQVVRVFAPVVLAFCLSFVIFGWYLAGMTQLVNASANISVFPWLVPIAPILFVASLRRRNQTLAMPVGLCISPYFSMLSLNAFAVAMLRSDVILVASVSVYWIVQLIR